MIPYYRLLIVVLMNVLVNMCLYGFSIVFVAAQLSTNSALQSSEVLTAATYFQKPFPPHSAMTMEGGEHDAGLWQNCNLLLLFSFLATSTGWLFNVGYDVTAHDSKFCCWLLCEQPHVCRCMCTV